MARFKPQIPCGIGMDFPQIFCPSDAVDFEKITWNKYGAGGVVDGRHCFVDDWRIEHLWRKQGEGLAKAILSGIITTPDFSIDLHFPEPYAVYQHWRSVALGSFWQDAGVVVVPTLQWSIPALFEKTSQGIVEGSVVAVRGPQFGTEDAWCLGAQWMAEHLKPSLVIHFGNVVSGIWDNAIYRKLRL